MDTETNKVIDDLCERFGTTAERLVPEMARYHILMETIAVVLLSALVLLCVAALLIFWKKSKEDCDWEDVFCASFVCTAIVVPICIAFVIINATNMIAWKMYPEIKAMETVLGLLGG